MSSAYNELLQRYPRLRDTYCEITSPEDSLYNCVAWAAEADKTRVWIADPGIVDDPEFKQYGYWPPSVPRDDTLQGWIRMFASLGFRRCHNPDLEPGFEKVAIYGSAGSPMHAARQTPAGRWASKLGRGHDIEHDLEGLTGSKYGDVLVVLRRKGKKSGKSARNQARESGC